MFLMLLSGTGASEDGFNVVTLRLCVPRLRRTFDATELVVVLFWLPCKEVVPRERLDPKWRYGSQQTT